jgi:hypothetical protein
MANLTVMLEHHAVDVDLLTTVTVNTGAALAFMALVLAGVVILLMAERLNRRCEMPGHRCCPSCDIPVPTGAR